MNGIIITLENATIFTQGKSYTISNDHPSFKRIVEAAQKNDWEKIPTLTSIEKSINEIVIKSGSKDIVVKGEHVVFRDIMLPADLSQYVINMIRDKGSLDAIIKFMNNLVSNPDKRIIDQMFGFLSYGKNPMTSDGCFLAYKRVNDDYTSVHDRKTMNHVKTVVKMPRASTCVNPHETCSSGLHFCSMEYLSSFSGSRIMVLKINPRDVVSIPVDYNNTKGRACEYEIIDELTEAEKDRMLRTKVDVLKVATVDDRIKPVDDSPPVSKARALYDKGYKDGRSQETASTGNEYYAQGYKDGRCRRKKTFVEPVEGAEEVVLVPEHVGDYHIGYSTGRYKKIKYQEGLGVMYEQGYADGKSRKPRQYPKPE